MDDICTIMRAGFVEQRLGNDYAVRVLHQDDVRAIEVDVMVDGDEAARLQIRGAGATWATALGNLHRANITPFALERPIGRVAELIRMCEQVGSTVSV